MTIQHPTKQQDPTGEPETGKKQTMQNSVGKANGKKQEKTTTTTTNKKSKQQQEINQLKTENNNQKQQIRDLKSEKKKATDENNRLKAKINELEKQAVALKTQQRKTQEETKTLKHTNRQLTEEHRDRETTQDNIITQLENDIKDLNNTIQDKNNNQEDNEATIHNLRKELEEAQQQQEPQDQQAEIHELKQKLKEAEDLTDILFEKLDKQPESDENTLTVEPTTKPKCLLVADSNRREIIPFLDRNLATWHHENDIFTTEQLQQWSNNPPQEYEHIVIMQGTNDIQYGKDGYRMAKKNDLPHTKQLEKDLPQTTILTLNLPPLKNKDNNKEINLYNYTLARKRKTTETSKSLREVDVHEIIRVDGIHLTPRGGK